MNTPRHMLNVLRLAVALLFASALMSRCASMMTPTGGPRDTLPPVILNMTPDNFSVNRPTVHHEKIYIEFDEFVQLKDQQKEFFTSPAMKKIFLDAIETGRRYNLEYKNKGIPAPCSLKLKFQF